MWNVQLPILISVYVLTFSSYRALIVCLKLVVTYFVVCFCIWGQIGLFNGHCWVRTQIYNRMFLKNISLVFCARCRPGWGQEQKIIEAVQNHHAQVINWLLTFAPFLESITSSKYHINRP